MKRFVLFLIIFLFGKSSSIFAQVGHNAAIHAFWNKTKAELSRIPVQATITPINEALPYKTYFVTVTSLNNVTVAGYLSVPVQGEAKAKPWPVLVTTSGYSGNGQGVQLNECQRGYIVLQVYPRGQGVSSNYFHITSDKLSTKLNAPEGYYYQGAYADIIRMIDYVITRPDVDTSRIAMVGTSQAGGIALAVTALDARIKTVVAHVPFLCNLRMAATMPSLAKSLLDRAGAKSENFFNTLDYFDPFVLAPRIKVPVFMTAGGKDVLCPAPTIQSVYDRITSPKEYRFYPDLPHTSCMDSYALTWLFLNRYFLNNDRKQNVQPFNRQ